MAQKKELSQARTYLKSGKDFDKAEKLMTGLISKDSTQRSNKRVLETWFETVEKQYEVANEKLYLKQKQDTAAFFSLISRMFVVAEALDSAEMQPDNKGRVQPASRQHNREKLLELRPNLFQAGLFFMKKDKFEEAFSYFEQYIDCARQPLFAADSLATTDGKMAEAAYWSTTCAYRMHDAVRTLRYRDMALGDTARAAFTYQYIAQARKWLGDDELYLKAVEQGFKVSPTSSYFFPRLMDAYTQKGNYPRALETAEEALKADSASILFLFAKSTVLLQMKRYAESIPVSKHIIALNDTLAEAYYNAGSAYLNMAINMNPRKEKKQQTQYFQDAKTHFERYRQMAPDEVKKWGPPLYQIYLNLNLGKEFDELDRLMK